jgi:hypothetical protein
LYFRSLCQFQRSTRQLHSFSLESVNYTLDKPKNYQCRREQSYRVTPLIRWAWCATLSCIGTLVAFTGRYSKIRTTAGILMIATGMILWWLPFASEYTRGWVL